MAKDANDLTFEDFWRDVRPERLPPADLSPYKELLKLIDIKTQFREMILEEYIDTTSGREKLFSSYTEHPTSCQRNDASLHLYVLARFLRHCDGSENIDVENLTKIITYLNGAENEEVVYVGVSYQGQYLRHLGLVQVSLPDPRHITIGESNELLDAQDPVPLNGLFYIIEGHFFPNQHCLINQFELYRSREGHAQSIASQLINSVGISINPPFGVKFKLVVGTSCIVRENE